MVGVSAHASRSDGSGRVSEGRRQQEWETRFDLSAILGAILGVYCFTLPHTPPQKGKQAFATWEAHGEVQRNPRLMALFLISIVISCIHQFYFVHTAKFVNLYQSAVSDSAGIKFINRIFGVGGGGLMTIGQLSELVALSLMSFLVKRFSRKTLLAVGIIAYAARMALFAYAGPISTALGVAPLVVIIIGLAMHGLVFGCFIFVAFLIVDEETTTDVRASAQSLYNLIVFGFGIIVGSQIATMVAEWATPTARSNSTTRSCSAFQCGRRSALPCWN